MSIAIELRCCASCSTPTCGLGPKRTGAASPLFCLFVLALSVVVAAVVNHGLGQLLGAILPHGTGLLALLGIAGIAALLANAAACG